MEKFSLGDTQEMSENLLFLVKQGIKRGTSWSASLGDFNTKVNDKIIITDFNENPVILIKVLDLDLVKFKEVSKDFALIEGEGDFSIDYWRKSHKKYFEREGTYSENMAVYCMTFEVIKIF